MTPREAGFLLLGSCLGDPARRPLTPPQLQRLAQRVRLQPVPGAPSEELSREHLLRLGCTEPEADRILSLLSETARLRAYLCRARDLGLTCLTCVSPGYPPRLSAVLGDRAPAVLWLSGDVSLLQSPCIALVGSRELQSANRMFAQTAGREIARQGFTLVSGGARGADTAAQQACLAAGGRVIAVLAGPLRRQVRTSQKLLHCCEDSFDLPFSPVRALSRNRIIHVLGEKTLVAQSSLGSGGTWSGTEENLRRHWSPVFLFDDGSSAARALQERGAAGISDAQLRDLSALSPLQAALF